MSLRHAVHGLLRDRLRPFAAACFLIAVLLFAAMDTFGRATELEEHGILSGHFSDRLNPQLVTEARLEGEGLPDALRRNNLPALEVAGMDYTIAASPRGDGLTAGGTSTAPTIASLLRTRTSSSSLRY